jgi:hypothetical protein
MLFWIPITVVWGPLEESHMQPLPENAGPADRRGGRKSVGGVLALYGALIIITVRIAVGHQLPARPANEPAVTAGERQPAHIGATPVRQSPDQHEIGRRIGMKT